RGGRTAWTNVVAACTACNRRKGARTPRAAGLVLLAPPREPTVEELMNTGRRFPPNHLHESWIDFLYWDAELEA
ncbi:MAG: HNH endonuclease, partial [Rhodobacteraceae bacterium]|nr:HNH endonuclease [Paracoccaceae bacterium]